MAKAFYEEAVKYRRYRPTYSACPVCGNWRFKRVRAKDTTDRILFQCRACGTYVYPFGHRYDVSAETEKWLGHVVDPDLNDHDAKIDRWERYLSGPSAHKRRHRE